METPHQSKTNPGIGYGLIAGLIVTLFTLVQYLGGVSWLLSPIALVTYVIVITMAVLAALRARKENEGFLEFSQALKITFAVFALAFLLQTLFSYVLFNFIDVSFGEAYAQETLNRTEQMFRKLNMDEAKIREEMSKQSAGNPFAFGKLLLGYGVVCIVSFIFCLLISLIVKKSKPAFDNI